MQYSAIRFFGINDYRLQATRGQTSEFDRFMEKSSLIEILHDEREAMHTPLLCFSEALGNVTTFRNRCRVNVLPLIDSISIRY